jgi:hypothetical protein
LPKIAPTQYNIRSDQSWPANTIVDLDTPRAELTALKKRFELDTEEKKQSLGNKYKKVLNGPSRHEAQDI